MRPHRRSRAKQVAIVLAACFTLSTLPYFRHTSVARQGERRLLSTSGTERVGRIEGRVRHDVQRSVLIPRVVHQTYKSNAFTRSQLEVLGSWKARNPGWEFRFYDDSDCLKFVQREFPSWLSAYRALPLAVERADFFRYMVILRHGGLYADVDTECGLSLDDFILPDDSFVAGWEDEHYSAEQAVRMNFARQRQLEQWVFAATPGHPVLQTLCELIASMAFEPVRDHRIDALFRTGPAPFTDVVLRHAFLHPLHLRNDPHRLRILPRVTFGGLPSGAFGISPWAEPNRVVRHLSAGSWKTLDFDHRYLYAKFEAQRTLSLLRSPSKAELSSRLFPVSTLTEPPFTVMTHMIGQGDDQGGIDVAAQITKWGAALAPGNFLLQQQPLDVFLDAWNMHDRSGKVLLDIGAGLGYYSLGAAARGKSVEAFELAPRSLASLQASIEYNGFDDRINIHKVALGMWNEEVCVAGVTSPPCIKTLRGYGRVQLPRQPPLGCVLSASRRTPAALRLNELDVGAIRISASGWESWIVGGLKEILVRQSTQVVLLELYPALQPDSGFRIGWRNLLEQLHAWGFVNTTHMGHVCLDLKTPRRWLAAPRQSLALLLSRRLREQWQQQAAAEPGFEWCTYNSRLFKSRLRALPNADTPEVFLLRK